MRQYRFYRTILGLACGLLMAVAGESARGDSLTISLGTQFAGEAPVGGTAPWVTANFVSSAAGTVDLTITNNVPYSTLGAQEFITQFVFNTTGVTLSNLGIAQTSSTFTGPASAPVAKSTATGSGSTTSSIQALAGAFDVALNWRSANNSNRFDGGGTVVYFQLNDSKDMITAASFDAVSSGGYLAAAKVQGIPLNGGTTSSTIAATNAAVPEPSSAILALFGLAGASSLGWFRRRKSS